jgi:hypothetical protein
MIRKLMPVALASALLVILFCINPPAWSFERHTPSAIPPDQILPPSATEPERPVDLCEITNDTDNPAYYFDSLVQGCGMAVYMNPAYCGPSPYPFKITDVHFYLWEFDTTNRWPVLLRVNIREVSDDDSCNGPGQVICYEDFSIPAESAFPSMVTLNLSTPCCVGEPFFLEIIYTQTVDPAHWNPSLLMEAETPPADTCDNWMSWDGEYWEWWDFWAAPPPGNAIIRATGYTNDPACEDYLWYWKADKPGQTPFPAPSGMPDFDQYQFAGDSVSLCGPTAVANCLWWFNAVPTEPENMTPPDLIRRLCTDMKCDPHASGGTYVDSMQLGLDQYISNWGFNLYEHTYYQPDFHEMEDSLKKSQDIILLIGFYDASYNRVGGHFVTMAGVCSESLKIAVSDPAKDAAVGGWPGRVRLGDHPEPPVDPTKHNDPNYVSQDIYVSSLQSPTPGNPNWGLTDYLLTRGAEFAAKFLGQNFQPGQEPFKGPDAVGPAVYTEVEFAVMICPTGSAVEGEEGSSTPKSFELRQNYPNPFNNQTLIRFDLRRPEEVSLTIYNILGQKVRTLVEGRMSAGSQTVGWDGKDEKGNDLSSGVYFYRLKAGQLTETKRLVLLK